MTALPDAAGSREVQPHDAQLPTLGVCVVGSGVLAAGAALESPAVLVAVVLLQVGVLVAWWRAVAPPGPVTVLGVAVGVATAADVVAVHGSILGLAGALGVGVLATIVAQLTRGVGRTRVVEAFGSTLTLCLSVVAFALLPFVVRTDGADRLLQAATAAGVALVLARVTDLVVVWPRLLGTVSRGGVGLAVGTAGAAGAAALCADAQSVATPGLMPALGLGAVVGLVAVLMDIAGACLLAELPARRFGFGLGPLMALMSATVIAYVYLSLVVP